MARLGVFSMTTDVIVYVSSVANPRKHARKTQCLESFAAGAAAVGASVHTEWANKYMPSRLAVILGWVTADRGGPNVELRRHIINEQQRRGAHVMCIDASCWKYLDQSSRYLRYSIGGPFYDKNQYANRSSGPDKWNHISQDLGLSLQPHQHNPNGHILICMQRDGGFAMKTLNPMTWLDQKISQLRRHTQRSILIRPHPGSFRGQDFARYQSSAYQKMGISVANPVNTTLLDNLQGAWAAVYFNSSASVAAVCQGIPVFADDSSCVSWDVANHDIENIEQPQTFDRQCWVQDLAAAHWSDQESQQGLIYQKFLPYITGSR